MPVLSGLLVPVVPWPALASPNMERIQQPLESPGLYGSKCMEMESTSQTNEDLALLGSVNS